ncbi:MAG: LptF/LptG family permease [Bacteroidales bacterium]|nr:LptF/LptG family permease [Bacteroidales bacterium]
MKQVDKLILRSFIGPLVLTFLLAVFVLLMQFLWKYIDDMVGKGLDFWIIAQLLFYASATFVPMALPIATLFASIMTMGNFGEKYELIAMKAGGISIRRVMMPMAVVVLMLTGMAFYFANNVMPIAVLKYKMTLYDVTRKKPALNIKPSEYYSGIDGYVIRVDQKDKENKNLKNIIIYDHTDGMGNVSVTIADRGKMTVTPDERFLIFDLYDGYSYVEDIKAENYVSRPMTRMKFDEQTMKFDLSAFAFNKSDKEYFKGSYQMMNIRQLDETIDTLKLNREAKIKEYENVVNSYFPISNLQDEVMMGKDVSDSEYIVQIDKLSPRKQKEIQRRALYSARTINEEITMYSQILQNDQEYINRHGIEWHQKFTLSVACFVLFLIGAPFGSIVRKGGLGLPLVASVIFFVLYYVINTICIKAIREVALPPYGMWISTVAMLPLGIFLTLKATTDSSVFDKGTWRKMILRIFVRSKKKQEIR